LDECLITKVVQLVRLGNWSTLQLEHPSDVLTATDTAVAIDAVLLELSRQLVQRIDHIWERRKKTREIYGSSSNASPPRLATALPTEVQIVHPQSGPVVGPKVLYRVRNPLHDDNDDVRKDYNTTLTESQ